MAEVLDNAWDLSSTLRLVLFIATILSYSPSQLIFLVSVSAVKLGPLLHILTYSFSSLNHVSTDLSPCFSPVLLKRHPVASVL